jgi:hypothetical protein
MLNSTELENVNYAITLSYFPAHIISSTFFFFFGLLLVAFILPFLRKRRKSCLFPLIEKEIFLPTSTFLVVSIVGFFIYVGFFFSVLYFHIPSIFVFGSLFGIVDNINQCKSFTLTLDKIILFIFWSKTLKMKEFQLLSPFGLRWTLLTN